MNIKDYLEIVTYVLGCIVIIWRVAEVKEFLRDEIQQLDKRLDLHIQSSMNARESLSNAIEQQSKRFGTKYSRLEQRMTNIEVWYSRNFNFSRRASDTENDDEE